MPIRSAKLGGTDWTFGETPVPSADLKDTYDALLIQSRFFPMSYTGVTNQFNILAFSSSIWQTNQARTTDSGSAWSASLSGEYVLAQSRQTPANAVAIITNAPVAKYTTDSGATWNTASTAPPNITKCVDISYAADGRVVCFGTASSGSGIWYSTDNGDNWSQGTGIGTTVIGGDMFSATVGYAIDSALNIWKSTNGIAWTDTTDNATGASSIFSVRAIDADNIYYNNFNTANIVGRTYDNSTNTETPRIELQIGTAISSKVIKSSGGNYYFVALSGNVTNEQQEALVYKSEDDCVTWSVAKVPYDTNQSRITGELL
jgi:hypothetical protein